MAPKQRLRRRLNIAQPTRCSMFQGIHDLLSIVSSAVPLPPWFKNNPAIRLRLELVQSLG